MLHTCSLDNYSEIFKLICIYRGGGCYTVFLVYWDVIDLKHGISLRCTTYWFGTLTYCSVITAIVLANSTFTSYSYRFFFYGDSISCTSWPTLVTTRLSDNSHSNTFEVFLILGLIGISPMMSDAERLLIYVVGPSDVFFGKTAIRFLCPTCYIWKGDFPEFVSFVVLKKEKWKQTLSAPLKHRLETLAGDCRVVGCFHLVVVCVNCRIRDKCHLQFSSRDSKCEAFDDGCRCVALIFLFNFCRE